VDEALAAFLFGEHEAETRCVPPRYAAVAGRHFHALPLDLDHASGLFCEPNHEAVLERRIRRLNVLEPEDFAFEVGVEIAVAANANLLPLSRCCVRCQEREWDFVLNERTRSRCGVEVLFCDQLIAGGRRAVEVCGSLGGIGKLGGGSTDRRRINAKDMFSEFGRGSLDTQFCGATFDAVANGISDLASEPRKSHSHAHRQ
jgi:hypothetical protein